MPTAKKPKVPLSEFSRQLLNWYQRHKRELPWRNTGDPYKIWLSEIILQQTQVAQGLPYYETFVETFPTVHDLAAADQGKVLRLWQGLGYYSRARNLHFAAQQVVGDFNGRFPKSYEEIITLKGVGEYTAAAIASFAFGEKVPVLDGNVIRVLTRYFGIEEDVSKSKTIKALRKIAREIIPENRPDEFNQAIMEFGALHCTPRNPKCVSCPFNQSCEALAKDTVSRLPYKSAKIKKRNRYFYYLVYRFSNRLAMQQRTAGDIWQGLYEFPLIEKPTPLKETDISGIIPAEGRLQQVIEAKKHVLSHQNIYATFLDVELSNKIPGLTYYTINEIKRLGKPILIENYLQKNIFY